MEGPPPPRALAIAAPAAEGAAALAWPALCAIAALAAVVPLWAGHFLPFQDAPQHLAAVRVLADYGTPRFGFQRWFELDLARSQYLGFYLPAAVLSRAVGPDAACRIVLSAIALALPAVSWMLLRSFDRDARLAVLAPALFHTAPLYLGFFNFVASVPATVLVVALAERELRGPRPGRAVVLAIAAAALLYLHPSALAVALGATAFLAITSGTGLRRSLRGLAPFAPAMALLAVWIMQSLLAQSPGVAGRSGPTWLPLRERALDLARFGNVLAGHDDEAFLALLLLLWVAAILVPRRPRTPRSWRLPALAAGTLIAFCVVPESIGAAGSIHLRALPLLGFLALAAPALAPGRATSALLAVAVAVQAAYGLKLVYVHRSFDAEAEAVQLEQVLQAAEPGRRLLSLMHHRDSSLVQFQAYQHFGMYYQVEKGGRSRRNFAELPWTPVRFRADAQLVPLPPGWEEHPDWFDPAREGAEADYLLVRGPAPRPPGPFALKAEAGRWALYEALGRQARGR